MLCSQQVDQIRSAFVAGTLRIRSVSPTGEAEWKRVLAVHRAEVESESIHEAHTEQGPMVLTGGHRVFLSPNIKTEMENLSVGQQVLGVSDTGVVTQPVIKFMTQIPDRKYMYDLTAEDWHNFVLHRSGVVISNSPDRNYSFRPPNGEGVIGCFSQVHGYIWQDAELLEYLQTSLENWNSFPPATYHLCTLDQVCQSYPAWKGALKWGAIGFAALAAAFNGVADEFSVSPDTLVRVQTGTGWHSVPIEHLYNLSQLTDRPSTGSDTDSSLWAAIKLGSLHTEAVDPDTGSTLVVPVEAVLRHAQPKGMVRTTIDLKGSQSSVETTVDHSLFTRQGDTIKAVRADELRVGDTVALVIEGLLCWGTVVSLEPLPPIPFTYDLSVPGPENFVLANGILAHNSYSIGGISLDIERSSKYQSLADNAQSQLERLTIAKQQTLHYVRGLRQPKFGIGVRAGIMGPASGRGVISPRSFLVMLFSVGLTGFMHLVPMVSCWV